MTSNKDTTSFSFPSRLGQWFALGFFAAIALIALVTRYDNDFADERAVVKWALSVICIAVGTSGLAIIATLAVPEKFHGTKVEGGMSALALSFLSAGLPSIMNVSRRLAVNKDGSIRDGNLYFFCWFSLFAALVVFFSYLSENHSVGFGSIFSWPFLCLTSFVVMASAIDLWDEHNWCDEENETSEFCSRAKFAVMLGAICGLFSLIWTFVKDRAPAVLDKVFSILVCVLWSAAVSVITFGGSKAPGREVGNLFFFTWASFGIAMMMGLSVLSGFITNDNDSISGRKKATTAQEQPVRSESP